VLSGLVTDSSGAVITGAQLTARGMDSTATRTTTSDPSGLFKLEDLRSGSYRVRIEAVGFQTTEAVFTVGVANSAPVTIVLPVKSAQESVTVDGSRIDAESSARAHTEIGSSLTDTLPKAPGNGGVSAALTLATPGVAADSNGSFHPLGEHAEVSFNVDGQPITDQQSRTFSNQVSLNAIDSIDVVTGAPPAEFGDKTSMVVRAVTRSGLKAGSPKGSVSLGYGSFGTGTGDVSLLVGDSRLGNFFSAAAARSGRFLDTPEFVPLHAVGNTENVFDRFDIQPTAADSLHLNVSVARSWFQTPNTYLQQESAQDQRQLMSSRNVAGEYSHVFNASWVLNGNGWWRQDDVNYYPSLDIFADQPATFSQNRKLTRGGGRIDLSFSRKRHNVKTGILSQWTSLGELFTTGLTDAGFNSPCLDLDGVPVPIRFLTTTAQCAADGYSPNPEFQPSLLPYDLTRGGALFQFRGAATIKERSAYVQDAMRLGPLAINLGLRADGYDGISHSSALEPRAGLSYQLPYLGTIVRVSFARVMITPYNENLVLSSSTGPGGLASGALGRASVMPLVPGRRNQYNAGLTQAIGKRVTVDAEYFWKFAHGAYDFNVILNTPLNFPIQFDKAKIDGAIARISLAPTHGFSAFTVMGHTRSRLFSPEIGGINFGTQYAPVARPDHDQAFQQTTFVHYQPASRAPWLGFTWRFDSGLVVVGVPDRATALTLTGDEQSQMGLYCGPAMAAVARPVRACASPNFGATRVHIVANATYDPDRNPSRIVPRNLFDVAAGLNDIWHSEPYHLDAKLTAINLTDKVALYNFLSSFSGTHFVTPRAIQAELKLRF
jgi:hypothetical protein